MRILKTLDIERDHNRVVTIKFNTTSKTIEEIFPPTIGVLYYSKYHRSWYFLNDNWIGKTPSSRDKKATEFEAMYNEHFREAGELFHLYWYPLGHVKETHIRDAFIISVPKNNLTQNQLEELNNMIKAL